MAAKHPARKKTAAAEFDDSLRESQGLAESGQLRREVGKLKRALLHAETLRRNAEHERDAAEAGLALLTALPTVEPSPLAAKPVRPDGCATAMLLCSDWHVEQVIESARVQGLNSFNEEVAGRRVERLTDRALMLLEKQRAVTKIDELVVWLGGDFISGTIHDELLESNSLLMADAVAFAEDLIATMLATLAKHAKVKRITIPCSYGNHGRTTKKPRVATGAGNNLESLAFRHLAKQLGPKIGGVAVDWRIPAGQHVVIDVRGMLVRFQHGDAIKYQGGVGGITIPVNKALAAWNQGQRVGLDVFGHWHQFLYGRKFIANGCLVGYDEFALSIKAEYQPPTQTFVVIDGKYGVTSCEQIFLEEPKAARS